MSQHKPQLVIVDWHDSTAHAGWTDEEGVKRQSVLACQTIGWLVEKDKTCLKIASTRSEDYEWLGRQSIPRGCVLRVRALKLKVAAPHEREVRRGKRP